MTTITTKPAMHHTSFRQGGYTLVELMVALVLGLILTAAVVQSYTSTKQTYRITEGVSRVQENARFAMHFVSKDVRGAGFASCMGKIRNQLNGDPAVYLSNNAALGAWNYAGTESGDTPFVLSGSTLSIPTTGSSWIGNSDISTTLPGFLNGEVVEGSDVLWFKRYVELEDIQIASHAGTDQPFYTDVKHDQLNNSIMVIGNCSEAELFQARGVAGSGGTRMGLLAGNGTNGSPGNREVAGGSPLWNRTYGVTDSLFAFEQTFYYVGEGASGLPSLFRFRSARRVGQITNAILTSTTEELVEGVETLQVLLGEDTDDDRAPNRYISANEVTDWENVVSARIGLLLRSPNNAADEDQATDYQLLDSIDFTHANDDSLLRYAVNTTIKPRNRGLDPSLDYYVCDTVDEPSGDPDNGVETCP